MKTVKPVRPEGAQRQRDPEREHRVGHDHPEIEDGDLAVARADGLHDPDLAGLLGDDRVDRVDDEEARREEGQEAEEAEDEEDAGKEVVGRVLAGRRHEDEGHGRPGPLHPLPDRLRRLPDLVAGRGRVIDEDPHVIVRAAVAEIGKRREVDVAGQPPGVEGGRGPDLVGQAGDAEPVGRPVAGLDLHLTGRRDVGQGEARALQEQVAAPRRPGSARLRRHEVEALVLEVGDRGELQLAVRLGAGPEPDRDAAARLGVGDPAHAADGLDEVVVERGGGNRRARRSAGEVHVAQALAKERVGAGDRPDGEDADGDREDDEHRPGAGDAEVAEDLAPADARHGRAGRRPRRRGRRPRSAARPERRPERRRRPPAPRRRGASRRGGCRRSCGRSVGRARRSRGRG